MERKIHEFNVEMTCEGCSSAVERVLKKNGINEISIDLPTKKVIVTSTVAGEEILEYIKKTGKPVSYVGSSSV